MDDPLALTLKFKDDEYITKLGVKKVRDILLSFGEPLPEGKLRTALQNVGFNKNMVNTIIKSIKKSDYFQKGNRGWRAV